MIGKTFKLYNCSNGRPYIALYKVVQVQSTSNSCKMKCIKIISLGFVKDVEFQLNYPAIVSIDTLLNKNNSHSENYNWTLIEEELFSDEEYKEFFV